eukprot:472121_1
MVDVDDEVELTKNRVGVIRYKGPLEGKNGIFYGVELSQGSGKHSGLFKGQRYFMCQKGKGVFVDKKQILYKLQPSAKKDDKKKKKKKKGDTGGAKGPGRIDRKGGPRDEKKPKKKGKGGWKPPSWTKDVLEDDGGFLDYRPALRGKTGRAEYG